jgi:exonuclease VII large subunit
MDKEIKEYLDRISLGLTAKEDLEKLRQEMKSSFRQLKEENKNQILEWKQEIKADLEQLKREGKVDIDPVIEGFRNEIRELKIENRSAFDQSIQKVELLLQEVKEEAETRWVHSKEGAGTDTGGLKDGMESLGDAMKKVAEEVVSFREKMKEGFVEVKEELGSMIKFSYADLEKKFSALEARIKALEKMVFP